MKKILSLVLAMVLALGVMGVNVIAQTPDRVEITFRVGDSILNINGNPVEVETPFIAGEGVTLVPLRVITEAFGADVEWVAETREVVLNYQNVEIVLQIDNINVYVNGQRQTLLHQPVISNDVTMVPLRFITENFGADVGWNAETQAITVIKEAIAGSIVDIEDALRRSNMAMVGDSYLGWSMRRTPGMELWFRSFDGWRNTFTLSHNANVRVNYFVNGDSETLDAVAVREMNDARRNTLIGQTRGRTSSGAEFVATQYRDRSDFIESRVFVRPNDRIVQIVIAIDNGVTVNEREEYRAILDTFDFIFNANETEDLSDVIDGMRLFNNRELNIQLRMPADYMEIPNPDRANSFLFGTVVDGVFTGMTLEIVSLQSGDSAERWAREALEASRRRYNPNLTTLSALRTMQVGGVTASYFQIEGRAFDTNITARNIFWEYEGYMYNLNITVPRANAATIQRIVSSVSFSAINANAVGVIMRQPIEENIVFSSVRNTSEGFTLDVPASWVRLGGNTLFIDESTGIEVLIMPMPNRVSVQEARTIANGIASDMRGRVVSQPETMQSSDLSSSSLSGITFEIKTNYTYGRYSIISSGNRTFAVISVIPEIYNSPANRETVARMIRSFAVN